MEVGEGCNQKSWDFCEELKEVGEYLEGKE